ncbi:rac GTPase-activating protein 1-like [Venturia canescens]|uniref:rac GTPase-activating protein 1-like n=1 Tax=Venturia canescens TaxID=32260 RepID=UPI001C9C56A3|nr:rac GTPase-activating protein 1-like [Venturia canescens]
MSTENPDEIRPSTSNAGRIGSGSDSTGTSGSTLKIREHELTPKRVVILNICFGCRRRIGFGKMALKCRVCDRVIHTTCQNSFPALCTPPRNALTQRGKKLQGNIADYVPKMPPLIPSLIVRCVREIEYRGLTENFSYTPNVRSFEARSLAREYLIDKKLRNLRTVDLQTIVLTLMIFLKSLSEPLVTEKLQEDFIKVSLRISNEWRHQGLRRLIEQLPRPNRDTLAYLMSHLKRMTAGPTSDKTKEYIWEVFGPIVVGGGSKHLIPSVMIVEPKYQAVVVKSLLEIESSYWTSFLNAYNRPVIGRVKKSIENFVRDIRDRKPESEESSRGILGEPLPRRTSFSDFIRNPRNTVTRLMRRNEMGPRGTYDPAEDEDYYAYYDD